MNKLDAKDMEILRELDLNYRQGLSKIAKKVKLSKNSVSLRFERLKDYLMHGVVGINQEALGYTQVRVFFRFNYYNKKLEQSIIEIAKNEKNIRWASRIFGHYDLCICFSIKDIHELISQLNNITKNFKNQPVLKDLHIIQKQFHFRHDFIHKKPTNALWKVDSNIKKIKISNTAKKILTTFRTHPKMGILEIAEKTGLTSKTISSNIKDMEKKEIIQGYFLTLNPAKFDYVVFKMLIDIKHSEKDTEFEKFLISLKNVRYIGSMIGAWDYEVDCVYKNMNELQQAIEEMKERFPNLVQQIEILSFGKRILTNKERCLE